MWYDQRNDNAVLAFPPSQVFGSFIIDPIPPPPLHTIDVRAAQTTGNGFGQSIQVSRYPLIVNGDNISQAQVFPLNWPLFGGGKLPFIGDYSEIVAYNTFSPPIGASTWTFNDYANESPILHGLWTDNRDVIAPITAQDLTNYAAPGTSACTSASLTTTRNQNLYSALLARGLLMRAEEPRAAIPVCSSGPIRSLSRTW